MLRVYLNSQVFTIMICLQQDLLSQRVDRTKYIIYKILICDSKVKKKVPQY